MLSFASIRGGESCDKCRVGFMTDIIRCADVFFFFAVVATVYSDCHRSDTWTA
jgi:hypothetical protein